MSTTAAPQHGRGSAAEQGARIRAQAEERRKSQMSADKPKKTQVEKRRGDSENMSAETTTRENERKSAIVARHRAKQEADEKKHADRRSTVKREQAKGAGEQGAAKDVEKRGAKDVEKASDEKTASKAGKAAAGAGVGAAAAPKLEKAGRCYPVSGIDNLALLMEGDSYQTTCFSVYMFRSELDTETLHRFFEKLTSSYPKYRYVVELNPSAASKKEKMRKAALKKGEPVPHHEHSEEDRQGRRTRYSKTLKAGGFYSPARWRYDDDFRFTDNIVELDGCPGGGKDEKALFDLAGDFLSEHFDYSKPLWKALCVRGIDTSEGAKSALMIKVHHALSDGQGMIMSYHTALTALEHDAAIEDVQAQVDVRTKKGEQKKPGQRNIQPTVWGTTKHGFHTVRGLYTRRRKAFDYQQSERTSKRFYCHSDGIPMADIKLVRDAFSDGGLNLSLNDVACAVLARALRMAAERTTTGKVTDKRVAVFVPISLRPPNNWELANYTTGGIAWFRFHDPKTMPFKDQLAQVNREMNRIKRSHWPNVWFKLFGGFARNRAFFVPNYPIGKQFFASTYREYHVATNLPGPAHPVKFGAHEAFSYHVLPPSSPGKSSLSIGMISYADDFSLAVSCDGVPEFAKNQLAERICQSFQDAAIELVEAAKEEARKSSNNLNEKGKPSASASKT